MALAKRDCAKLTALPKNRPFKNATLNIWPGRKYTSCVCAAFHRVRIGRRGIKHNHMFKKVLRSVSCVRRPLLCTDSNHSGTAVALLVCHSQPASGRPTGAAMCGLSNDAGRSFEPQTLGESWSPAFQPSPNLRGGAGICKENGRAELSAKPDNFPEARG